MLTVHPLIFRLGVVCGGLGDSYFLLLLNE